MEQANPSPDLARRLAELEVRIHTLETALGACRREREEVIAALVAQQSAVAAAGPTRSSTHVPSKRVRSPETSQRAAFIEEFVRAKKTATFAEVLDELRQKYGPEITTNHAIAVLKRPQFVREGRGRYAVRSNAELQPTDSTDSKI